MEKAKVYFTKELTPEAMERMYRVLGNGLSGKTAVKVHSGEMGNQELICKGWFLPSNTYDCGSFVVN